MQLACASITVSELRSSPGNTLFRHPLVRGWLKSRRWFMDKDADILDIETVDSFRIDVDEGATLCGLVVLFCLRQEFSTEYEKRYFLPLLVSQVRLSGIPAEDTLELSAADGQLYISLAEHSSLSQRFSVRSMQTSRSILTEKGNVIHFVSYGSRLKEVDPLGLGAESLQVSTSNVLTKVSTNRGFLIAKAYKDMRGSAGVPGRRWPPNMEMVRYEALAAAGYSHMPQLHGISTYVEKASGVSAPLLLLMDKIECIHDLGTVFWAGLSLLLRGDSGTRRLVLEVTREIARLLAFTVADFHHAFLGSGKPGFEAVSASSADMTRWSETGQSRYRQALFSLEQRSDQHMEAVVLRDLVQRLRALAPFELPGQLLGLTGRLKKAQVHGDLSSAQGLIDSSGACNPLSLLCGEILSGNKCGAMAAAESLVRRVRWMDFEGEPGKETVDEDYDTRQSLLVDVAGVIQGLWYLGSTRLYAILNLLPAQRPEHRESARTVSLALAGQIAVDDAGIEGLTAERVALIQEWLTVVCDAFCEGYLDKAEEHQMENAILTDWNRTLALAVIDYWVVYRALHELRYETYGREFGWEGIPAGRILQLTPRVDLASHAKV